MVGVDTVFSQFEIQGWNFQFLQLPLQAALEEMPGFPGTFYQRVNQVSGFDL